MADEVIIIGGGLAGCEAAFQIAKRGIRAKLYEMRPNVMTPAHRSGKLAELVCSSSLKSNSPGTAHGLLKEEMRRLGSIILDCAAKAAVPGGDALCVDRERFADLVTEAVEGNPLIEVIREEVTSYESLVTNEGEIVPCIIATGPLTSPALEESIKNLTGAQHLHFFDAIAPSVEYDSIDQSKVFRQSRYDKGEAAYINCPMTREEYEAFIDALLEAKIAHLHLEEERVAGDPSTGSGCGRAYFEGCMPVEEIARRGRDTLAHGTMKPVGLTDPHTGRRPHAVVQLRQENTEGSVYGLVGFQTQLRQSEQERVFRMIPGLEHAEFVRYGAVHRNTYIDSPNLLTPALHLRPDPPVSPLRKGGRKGLASLGKGGGRGLFFAGQLTGVEGYMESAASGILAGINAARVALGEEPVVPPKETILGALVDYVASCPIDDFQPMNSNFGILPELTEKHHKRDRKELKIEKARQAMEWFVQRLEG